MRAIHKYKHTANKGNKEAQRRIAQSYGYRTSIADCPKLVNLCAKAGILFDLLEYNIRDNGQAIKDYDYISETETITL